MSTPNPVPIPTTPRNRHRWRRVSLAFFVVLGALWFFNAPVSIVNHMASQALFHRDYEKAEQLLEWATRLDASNPRTTMLQARMWRHLREGDALIRCLKLARSHGAPDDTVRREELLARAMAGEIKPIQHELRGLMIDQRDDGPEISEAIVNGLISNGQIPESMVILDAWKKSFPTDGLPYYYEARIAEFSESHVDAEASYRKSLELQPTHRPSLYRLGRILIKLKRPQESIEYFKRISPDLTNAAATMGLAQAARESGNANEAKRYLKPLLTISTKQFDRGFVLVDEAPDEFNPVWEMGEIESELGNHAEALRYLNSAFQEEPSNLDLRYARAMEMRETDQLDEATKELADVARCRTDFSRVDGLIDSFRSSPTERFVDEKVLVGELYLKYGSPKIAEHWLKQALQAAPHHRKAHSLLADLYDRLATKRPQYEALSRKHRAEANASR